MLFFHVVSLSTSSSELRLRRNSMVTCECRSVNRKLESAIQGRCCFSVGRGWYSSIVFALFLGFSDASVGRCGRRLVRARVRLSSFCEVVLGSWRFYLCIDDVFFFLRRQFLKWFLRGRFVVLF